MRKRRYIALLISIIPVNNIRILLYNLIFRYKISKDSKVGILTIINVNKARITKATIGECNLFEGPYSLEVEKRSRIDSFNRVECGEWILKKQFKDDNYSAFCRFGENTLVSSYNYIDVTGGFELEENSVIGGRGSQFWTHGGITTDKSIKIGKNSYIGSATRFIPGVKIGDNVFVGVGSVVTKKFFKDKCLIAGNPAKIIKENYDWEWERT